jgi:hypothetical protein
MTLLIAIALSSYAQTCFSQGIQITKKDESEAKTFDSNFQLEDLKSLDYPELQVVPRASERLILESNIIREEGILTVVPYVTASLFTMASGFVVAGNLRPEISEEDKSDAKTNSNIAIGVGIGGLAISYWYIYTDHYGSTVNQIRGLRNKDRRTELLRERLAEETFEKSANLVSKWKWVFATANFLACAQLTGKSVGNNNIYPTLGMATALLPLFITSNFENNYQKQQEYKKRIYTPISWIDYRFDKTESAWNPSLNFAWNF